MKINERNRNLLAVLVAFGIVIGAVSVSVLGTADQVARSIEVRKAKNAWILP